LWDLPCRGGKGSTAGFLEKTLRRKLRESTKKIGKKSQTV
jgi:hypothetical protein